VIFAAAKILSMIFAGGASAVTTAAEFGTEAVTGAAAFLVPLGFSFYMMQIIAYLYDVSRDPSKVQKNPAKFMLYICYFPKLVSGPIERQDHFATELLGLRERTIPRYENWQKAIVAVSYGLLLKFSDCGENEE